MLKFADIDEWDHPGHEIATEMLDFYYQASEHDFQTKDGGDWIEEPLKEFGDMIFKHPHDIDWSFDPGTCDSIRKAVFALFAPKCSSWMLRSIRETLCQRLTKPQLAAALQDYGTTVNEYYRLRWLVLLYGGFADA